MASAAKPVKLTREKIITAFLDASFVNGAGATSLSDIAEKLGVRKATLYNHYSGKDALIADAIRWCGEYLRFVSLVPADLSQVCQQHTAEYVLKLLVRQWFKENEKQPLLTIYSFIESEKYFTSSAAQVELDFREKLTSQMHSVFSSLAEAGKICDIKPVRLKDYATIFMSLLRDYVDGYIVRRKVEIRQNPETGEDSLFGTLPFEDARVLEAERLVSRFVDLLRSVATL